ncbi:MAG: class I tRNA ligase family protein [Candidatus Colwellbacteria bacterium]|nr:class I tRNA ligase family protein [Candidatus Colwellbacteria bacterium]
MLKDKETLNLALLEEKVLRVWQENHIFEKSLDRPKRKAFHFYEGPPYANGLPGIHHVLSRVFKDIILRYKTMQGYFVPRKAGWDTHGLPIELAVEKELAIKNKDEIEKIGIDKFNQKAREIIFTYKDEWEKFTRRIGYWLDLDNAYVTYENSYIESLWWIFKTVEDQGYLKQSRKVVPYCPRCETPLSNHEMGMPDVYRTAEDPSIYVKFKLTEDNPGVLPNEYLLVWTTTPWTLPANMAVGVDHELEYTKYQVGDEFLWSYRPPPKLAHEIKPLEKKKGKELIGLKYEPLYSLSLPNPPAKTFTVIWADFVKTEEGTGLVHISPAFGEEDFSNWGGEGFVVTIDDQGRIQSGFPGARKFLKQADEDIIEDLKRRGLLYLGEKIEHEYPFCWRCSTPIVYFARTGWFFEMSRLREELLANNDKINWIPAHIKTGRFGEWIKNAVDWSISRERYWGTPLPIWLCSKGHRKVIGALHELDKNAFSKNQFFILRHAEAESNISWVLASGPEEGERKSALTEKGLTEARELAKYFKKEKIDLIFASPYERTRHTAEVIAEAVGARLITDERLSELNGGIFNWKKIKEHQGFYADPLEQFVKRPPEGENLQDVRERMLDFVREVNKEHSDKKILIVSHQAPLWLLETGVKHLSNEEALKIPGPNVSEWRRLELDNLPVTRTGEIDLHRPYIDEIYLRCQECGEKMIRVPDVADVWFDSGAMPWASGIEGYPADYIAEGIDQTRGWFYTLLAVATLLGAGPPYKNVISLGLINDKYGQKMSKSKGNVIDPQAIINKYGIDAVRWYFYTVNPPGEPKNFDEEEVALAIRRFFLILYNSFNFYENTRVSEKKKTGLLPKFRKTEHVLDRWILARLHQTIDEVTRKLEIYEIGDAARSIETLVDDLSRWYIRRSRRRGEMAETLGQVLFETSRLIAPFAPFFADALYHSTTTTGGIKAKISVHLDNWPRATKSRIRKEVLEKMVKTRKLAALALAKRNEAGVRVRQPLNLMKIKEPELKNKEEYLEILKEEVNVKEIVFDDGIKEEVELDLTLTPELKEEGVVRELVRLIQNLRREAKLKPKDEIMLFLSLPPRLAAAANARLDQVRKEVGARAIEFRRSDKFDAEFSTKIEAESVWLGLKKI